jgi:uncharacterized integral membrane protein (TIGR00697 family)
MTRATTESTSPRARKPFEYFPVVAVLFVTVLLVSNIVAQKPIALGSLVFPGAIILFPLAYILGDVLTEVYGYHRARLVIWSGLVANLIMVVGFRITVSLPSAPGWENQEAFSLVLNTVPRIVLASMIGYWAGEFSNAYVLAKMKLLTRGRFLWTRTIGSTLVGQAVDTGLFIVIAFWGVWPETAMGLAILSSYVFKVLYEAAATPLTYLVVGFLKREEGVDPFDRDTNFSPFRIRGVRRSKGTESVASH